MTVDDATNKQWAATIEALIFASEKPVREAELRNHIPDDVELVPLISAIHKRFDETSGIELCQVGDSWAFRTRAEIAAHLNTRQQVERPLSRAALEVLAIIAYHQPITRAEIEEIRGISLSRGTIDILLALGWIKPRGRRRTPGRPLTWGTSPAFLDHFGLADLGDLPDLMTSRHRACCARARLLVVLLTALMMMRPVQMMMTSWIAIRICWKMH